MNCWKTINVARQYGSLRILILSSVTMLLSFILLYLPVNVFIKPIVLYDNYFMFFLLGCWILYPTHKLFHLLPIAHLGKNINVRTNLKWIFFPVITVRVTEPIKKSLFLIALFMPTIIITAILCWLCWLFPHYIHYFIILMSYHLGICVPDFICAYTVIQAPKRSYIEENDEGYEILIASQLS